MRIPLGAIPRPPPMMVLEREERGGGGLLEEGRAGSVADEEGMFEGERQVLEKEGVGLTEEERVGSVVELKEMRGLWDS